MKMNEINKRFKQYRILSNITQDELARKSGVSVYTIKNFEGGSDIKLSTLEALLSSLGMTNTISSLIPDVTDRPSYRYMEEKKAVRMRAHKVKASNDWAWGEDR